jgi:hypothetical protein
MPHWLFLPDDAIGDLAILANLSPERVEALRSYFDSNEYEPRYGFYTKVAELLDISDDSAAELCTFISHVQSQRTKLDRDAESIPEELERFLARAAKLEGHQQEAKRIGEYIRNNKRSIIRLFSDFPKRDFSDKVRGLESGPIPHLHRFRTLCDLRPVYDKSANKIVTYLPMIILNMVIHRSWSENYEEVAVLLTEADVAEIREALARLDKKLVLLKKEHNIATNPKKEEG